MKRIKKLIGWVDGAVIDDDDEIKVLVLLDDDTMQFISMHHIMTPEYAAARKKADDLGLDWDDCDEWDWDNRYESTYIEYFYNTNELYSETWNIEYQDTYPSYVPCIELEDIDDLRGTYSCIQDNPGYLVEKITDNKYKIIYK